MPNTLGPGVGELPQEASLQVLESLYWWEERQVYGAAHELCSGLCGCNLLSWHHAEVGFLALKLPESPRNL